jgi:putative Mg2+ transporter-C (MgtC) family protein
MTAQVISGIGFLGAGTILVHRHSITGLTTAASLWNVACLGIAAGYGYISICLIGAGATLIVLAVIRRMLPFYMQRRVEISYANREKTLKFINSIFANQNIRVLNADYSIAREERSARFECLSEQDNPHNQTDCLGQDIRGSNPIEAARCSNTYTLGFPAGYDFIVFFRLLFEDPDVLAVRVIDG